MTPNRARAVLAAACLLLHTRAPARAQSVAVEAPAAVVPGGLGQAGAGLFSAPGSGASSLASPAPSLGLGPTLPTGSKLTPYAPGTRLVPSGSVGAAAGVSAETLSLRPSASVRTQAGLSATFGVAPKLGAPRGTGSDAVERDETAAVSPVAYDAARALGAVKGSDGIASLSKHEIPKGVALRTLFDGGKRSGVEDDEGVEGKFTGHGKSQLRAGVAGEEKRETKEVPAPREERANPGFRMPQFPRALWILLGSLFITQFGVEALGLGAPQLASTLTKSFTALAALSSASMITLTVGSLLGGPLTERFGPKRVYIGALVARAALMAGATALLVSGGLTAPWLIAFFAADYLMLGISRTVEGTMAPLYLGDKVVELNRFNVVQQVVIDGVGIVGPILAGAAILGLGYSWVFGAYPVLFLLAAGFSLWGLRGKTSAAPQAAAAAEPVEAATWGQALRGIWSSRVLRTAGLAYLIFNTVTLAIYFMIAPAFGFFAAGANAAAAPQVTSVMTGLYAAGGLAGAYAMHRVNKSVEKESASAPEGPARDAAARKAMLSRMTRWMAWGGVGLLSFWALLAAAPLATIAAPLYLAQLVMLPLGVTEVVCLVGLMTLVQSEAPAGAKAKTIAAVRFTALFAAFLASYGLGALFNALSVGNVPTPAAFVVLNLLLTAGGAAAFGLSRLLKKAAR